MKILIVGLGHAKYDDKIDRARIGGETKLTKGLTAFRKSDTI